MPNDAKLGLVVGVGLVIAVAVVFFRKDVAATRPQAESTVAATPSVSSAPEASSSPRGQYRPVKARAATRNDDSLAARRHTVKEGETLYGLAQQYYGDGDKFIDIYRVNREVLKTPDQLPPGTELLIPDLEKAEGLAVTEGGS